MFLYQYKIILTVKKSIIFLTKNNKVEGRPHLLSFWRREKEKPLSFLCPNFINGTIGTEHLKEFLGRTFNYNFTDSNVD